MTVEVAPVVNGFLTLWSLPFMVSQCPPRASLVTKLRAGFLVRVHLLFHLFHEEPGSTF